MSMKDKEVVFTDKVIHLKDNERSIVMDSASKKLMEMYSYVTCQYKANVLDIGFGMGYTANYMVKLASSYTVIEINPQIYEKALEWSLNKPNVQVIYGDWYEEIPKMSQWRKQAFPFNGIFMDTHDDPNYNKFEEVAKLVAAEGCILSIFNYFTQRDPSTMNHYEYKLEPGNFSKVVTPVHNIYWTHFFDGEWRKSPTNKIQFPEPVSKI